MISDDLRTPAVWKLVQQSPFSALVQGDELRIDACDGSWFVRAVVARATSAEVVLTFEKVANFVAAGDVCLGRHAGGVSRHKLVWRPSRERQDPRVQGHGSEGQAIDALRAYYPKAVNR